MRPLRLLRHFTRSAAELDAHWSLSSPAGRKSTVRASGHAAPFPAPPLSWSPSRPFHSRTPPCRQRSPVTQGNPSSQGQPPAAVTPVQEGGPRPQFLGSGRGRLWGRPLQPQGEVGLPPHPQREAPRLPPRLRTCRSDGGRAVSDARFSGRFSGYRWAPCPFPLLPGQLALSCAWRTASLSLPCVGGRGPTGVRRGTTRHAACPPQEGGSGLSWRQRCDGRKGVSLASTGHKLAAHCFRRISLGSGLVPAPPAPRQRQPESHWLGSGFVSGFSCSTF